MTTKFAISVCKDIAWFKEYIPFKSVVRAKNVAKLFRVLGVGTVELPVQREPNSHGILHLKDVLHIPEGYCNLVSVPFPTEDGSMSDLSPDTDGQNKGFLTVVGTCNQTLAILDRDRSPDIIKLSDPPIGPVVGPQVIGPYGSYDFDITWLLPERHRFELHRASLIEQQQQQQQQTNT